VFNWFSNKEKNQEFYPLRVDVHSHLLPGIDDGAKSLEDSEKIIRKLMELGFTKLITSPHVHELYRNSTQTILNKLGELRTHLKEKEIDIKIETIAEYTVDEWLMNHLRDQKPLLTFYGKHLLFETNFFAEPLVLNDFIFKISTEGYIPVLAHPERYMYLVNNVSRMEDLLARGVLFQLNTTSLAGLYGPVVEKVAKFMVDQKFVHLLGSDCHTLFQAETLQQAMKTKHFQKALSLPLLNHSL
jgi:protein-tyrosine phosphatase